MSSPVATAESKVKPGALSSTGAPIRDQQSEMVVDAMKREPQRDSARVINERANFDARFTHSTVLARDEDGAPCVIRALDSESVRDMDPRLLVRVDTTAPAVVQRRIDAMATVDCSAVGRVLDTVWLEGVMWVVTHESWPEGTPPRLGGTEPVGGASVLLTDELAGDISSGCIARLVAQLASGLEALAAKGVTGVGVDPRFIAVRGVAERREARFLAVGEPTDDADVRALGGLLQRVLGRRAPAALRECVRRCMGPEDERPTLLALREALIAAAATTSPTSPRRRWRMAAIALALAVGAGVTVALLPQPAPSRPTIEVVDVVTPDGAPASPQATPSAADVVVRGHLTAAASRLSEADRYGRESDESRQLDREALAAIARALDGRSLDDEVRALMERVAKRAWYGPELDRVRGRARDAMDARDPVNWTVEVRALHALDPTDPAGRFVADLDDVNVTFLTAMEPGAPSGK